MTSKYIKIPLVCLLLVISLSTVAQDSVKTIIHGYDPELDKIIPDHVIEMGVPLLILFLIANTIVSIFKIRAENRLKEKAIDRGFSEQTLITLFEQDKNLTKYIYLKWFLVLAAFGVSLILITILAPWFHSRSGYIALGIIALMESFAFLAYYRIIQKK